ncbi:MULTISPECIES: LysR family transcriptional regulator [unclassified Spirosoma]|uniref:LysR family transcriptional regulator n=1 Tax=unclassified Spirosoma TaxID=2621999 RepID=UPI0009612050|nr:MULTISPECIES: LysR family transcriptional regulator [unclassified Spirosoma]MBN8826884.1 LysR family transcriptional regulator [Spirosoma sp.]OJW75560.1 MAG: LysR family transcriptional regulator [Spirosoma sp. 48-14]
MNYTLHQLQVFLKIAQTQSITKAADELYLTQPAVSIQLKNFQDQFDIPLTEIIGRKLYLTDFGREIALAAEKIVNEVYAINYKTLSYKGLLFGRLRISVVSTGKYVMPYFLAGFLQAHEGIDLKMDVTNKQMVLESLANNEVDFALVSIVPQQLTVERIELMPNKLYFVGGANGIPQPQVLDPQALKNLPLIYREAGSGTRYMMEKFIADNQIQVRKKLELTSNEAVKQAIMAGLGYSIMPLIGIRSEIQRGDMTIIPVSGLPLQTSWNLIWLKAKPFSPISQAFMNYLELNKELIISERFAGYDRQ